MTLISITAFQQARAASFSGTVGELAAQFEFNFFPYSTAGKDMEFYSLFCCGWLELLSSIQLHLHIMPVIPFSFGFKVNIYKNLGLEAEYGFRKTFYDNFDGLKDLIAPSDYSWLHNNDWYTFTGIAVTWKIYNKIGRMSCLQRCGYEKETLGYAVKETDIDNNKLPSHVAIIMDGNGRWARQSRAWTEFLGISRVSMLYGK